MKITAEIIADSVSENGDRITTFCLEYPRFIHSELMTHRLFSRNAASSRAIPIEKMMEMVEESPAMPVEWGLNQSGMQAKELHSDTDECVQAWKLAACSAVKSAYNLRKLGLHKQIVNRVLEPFQWMKTIVTATEFDNFFWLRCHPDAQPEISVLAALMYEAYQENEPMLLQEGDWHLPYFETSYFSSEWDSGIEINGVTITLQEALKISASCCAQVSYRKLDGSLDKATKIYDQLVSMSPVHASPFEHQATPIGNASWDIEGDTPFLLNAPEGITHEDRGANLWSGNLKGFVQYRQLIKGNTCWDYKEETKDEH